MLSSNSKERGKWELGGLVLGHAATEQPRWHTQMQPTGKTCTAQCCCSSVVSLLGTTAHRQLWKLMCCSPRGEQHISFQSCLCAVVPNSDTTELQQHWAVHVFPVGCIWVCQRGCSVAAWPSTRPPSSHLPLSLELEESTVGHFTFSFNF